MIERSDVDYIAQLARLTLTEEEKQSFTRQLGGILTYMETLNSVDTSQVESAAFLASGHDPLREDTAQPSLPREDLLTNGPSIKKGHFAVPKVIG
jgi:aspartyl-tRNA(Asn)/glutamyl-tRNA(Gln) amidotransferase subunit C